MVCQECNMRQATLHFTKIINGKKTEMHVCEHCAREKGEAIPGTDSFSIHHLFSGLFHTDDSNATQRDQNTKAELKCPNCGLSYEKFLHIGRFGCASCYETYSTRLSSVFRRVHGGNSKHGGKIPKRIGETIQIEQRIEEMRAMLNEHIQKEEFEKAAELRDEIRALTKQKDIPREGEEEG
ncbi:UvrB/UvrC motif-containing protein [Shouchella hunanensis]|uniref:UvrB/UvrC motif-containing protein n=2 Tax=Shouchella hunanensis TaxID=766894 RepID=A0ABY7WC51_9BACI|nr:UvrB/UvrC motif-containing protein [Shouchella hunanensis]WDF05425.1 UvrB/UvrC motif-containing protein [Shouchella hunanensis]